MIQMPEQKINKYLIDKSNPILWEQQTEFKTRKMNNTKKSKKNGIEKK